MADPRDPKAPEETPPTNSYQDLQPRAGVVDLKSSAFAGRIGGNQRFTVTRDDPEFDKIKRDRPDATTEGTWAELCDLRGLREPEIWRSGFIELWGSLLNAFISGAAGIALAKLGKEYPPIFLGAVGAVAVLLTLPLFIHAAGPASGGHINSMITIATFTAKLAALPRTIVYVLMQNIGGVLGGYLLRAALGSGNVVGAVVPGCYWAPDAGITNGQVFVVEFVSCCITLFIAFGVGLDPRQRDIFGPALGPILIGVVIAILSFITGIMRPGYTGASMNPSRCFGLIAATQTFRGHWISWLAAITAACINGVFYILVPPCHAGPAKDEEQAGCNKRE